MKRFRIALGFGLLASLSGESVLANSEVQCEVLTRSFESGHYNAWTNSEMERKHEVVGNLEFDEFSLEKDGALFVARVYAQGRRITLDIANADGSRVMNNGGLSDSTDGAHPDMSVATVSPSRNITALVCQPQEATEAIPASVTEALSAMNTPEGAMK